MASSSSAFEAPWPSLSNRWYLSFSLRSIFDSGSSASSSRKVGSWTSDWVKGSDICDRIDERWGSRKTEKGSLSFQSSSSSRLPLLLRYEIRLFKIISWLKRSLITKVSEFRHGCGRGR